MRTLLRSILTPRSGASAVVQTIVANVAVQAANITSGILTARALGPGGRGALAAVLMWPQFLAYAITLGVPVASVYWLKRRPELARELTGSGLSLSIALGFVAAVAGMIAIPYSLHTYPPAVIRLAQAWTLITPFAMFTLTLMSQGQALQAFNGFNLYRFLSPLSVVLVLACEALTHRMSIASATFAYLFAPTPSTLWFAWSTLRVYRPSLRLFGNAAKLLLGYGLRAWGADLLGTIANQIDRILVVGMLSPEFMGLYVVAQSAAGVLAVLPTAVVQVSLPQSSGQDLPGILAITGKAVRATFYTLVCAAVPLLLLGKVLLRCIYGAPFAKSYVVLPFLVIEAIADGLTAVLAQALLAAGLPGMVTILQGVGLATSIPLLYLLIPRYGLQGAAAALMVSTLCRFTLVLLTFPFRLGVRPPGLLMSREEVPEFYREIPGSFPRNLATIALTCTGLRENSIGRTTRAFLLQKRSLRFSDAVTVKRWEGRNFSN